ncbi:MULTISPECIES: hypothetical protein [Sphingomonas]|jgi:hypothetical protein|uniref:hypothetical protein n=1 Tax=Sphingomonas TaxID=13687 RepID=UPI000AAAB42F|nr:MULTISPECIES: hypothetical protein [Sphingomonas]MBY0300803.1 hypothetical protein [Sphingomonas ginsenosidimutans]
MAVTAGAAPAPPLTIALAAGITLGVVVLIAGFLVLGAALGLAPLYAGFLILWYFGNIDMLDDKALPVLCVGALAGAATAWLLQAGIVAAGAVGAVPALAVIVAAIFCQLLGWLPLVINRAYMLYVTVLAAPLLQQHERFDRVLLTIVVATVYFGGVVLAGRRIVAMRRGAGA